MPNITNIVNVNIALGSQQVNVPGFGTGLILASFTTPADRFRVYTSFTAVSADHSGNAAVLAAAQLYFGQSQQPTSLMIGRIINTDATPLAALQAVQASPGGNAWYGLMLLDHIAADVLAIAAYIETQKKIFITSSADANILLGNVSSDIAFQLKALLYTRTACLYSAAATSWPEAGWMGAVLPLGVGNSTWKFKQIVGIAADDLNDTQFAAAEAKNANVYVPISGVNITAEGVMAGGQFIDLTRGIDALQAQIEADEFSLLVNNPKVPYTDPGIAMIGTVLNQDLQAFVDNGFLSANPKPVVTVPKAAAVSRADKQARVLNGVSFTATVAGAIHNIPTINGFLSF